MHLFRLAISTQDCHWPTVDSDVIESEWRQTLVSPNLPEFLPFSSSHLCLFLLSFVTLGSGPSYDSQQALGGVRKRRVTERTDRHLISLLWARTGQGWGKNPVPYIHFLTVLFSFSPSLHLTVTLLLSASRAGRGKNSDNLIYQVSVLFFTFPPRHHCTVCRCVSVFLTLTQVISAFLSSDFPSFPGQVWELFGLVLWKRSVFQVASIKPDM